MRQAVKEEATVMSLGLSDNCLYLAPFISSLISLSTHIYVMTTFDDVFTLTHYYHDLYSSMYGMDMDDDDDALDIQLSQGSTDR